MQDDDDETLQLADTTLITIIGVGGIEGQSIAAAFCESFLRHACAWVGCVDADIVHSLVYRRV